MVPTGLGAFLSNVLFSLELTPPSIEIWPLRAIYRERGVKRVQGGAAPRDHVAAIVGELARVDAEDLQVAAMRRNRTRADVRKLRPGQREHLQLSAAARQHGAALIAH